jgi:hypothetical protein
VLLNVGTCRDGKLVSNPKWVCRFLNVKCSNSFSPWVHSYKDMGVVLIPMSLNLVLHESDHPASYPMQTREFPWGLSVLTTHLSSVPKLIICGSLLHSIYLHGVMFN